MVALVAFYRLLNFKNDEVFNPYFNALSFFVQQQKQ